MLHFPFKVVDFGDNMSFSPLPMNATSDKLMCNDSTIPTDGRNLVIKAMDLYRSKAGVNQYFEIYLDKKVPHGGYVSVSLCKFLYVFLSRSFFSQILSNDFNYLILAFLLRVQIEM